MVIAIQMGNHGKILASSLRRGWLFRVQSVGVMMVIMFAQVMSEDQIGVPAAGLLCISECSSCPAICSPPPPSSSSLCPPPPQQTYNYQSPPPPSKPKPSVASLPPPPPAGHSNYPYYFFYSKASSIYLPYSVSTLLLLLLFSHVFYLC